MLARMAAFQGFRRPQLFEVEVTASEAPTALLTVTPNGLNVTADASNSVTGDNPIATYTFHFGDATGAFGPQAEPTLEHTYVTAGTYTVIVYVADTLGLVGSATVDVTVAGGPPGTAPTLPANSAVGLASWNAIGWDGYVHTVTPPSSYVTWKSWGCTSFSVRLGGANYLPAIPESAPSQQDLLDVSVVGNPEGKYSGQRAYESNDGPFARREIDPDCYAYISFKLAPHIAPTPTPPMGDWFDDARWSTNAAWWGKAARCMRNVLRGNGFSWDPEQGEHEWYSTYGGWTAAQIAVKAEARGYQCGSAYWQNFPDGHIAVYMFHPTGGYRNWLNGWYAHGDTNPQRWDTGAMGGPGNYGQYADPVLGWLYGWVRAMGDHGSSAARVIHLDSAFYKPGEGGGGSMDGDRGAKIKLNNEGMTSAMSRTGYGVGPAVWNKVCDRFITTPFIWAGTDPSFPTPTPPATFNADIVIDREWAMGPWRSHYDKGPVNANNDPTSIPYNPNYLPGTQAAASKAPIASPLAPTVANLSWTAGTVSCRAAHKYGVVYVRVYNGNGFSVADPEASYLGAMTMIWTHPSLPFYVGTPGRLGGNASASNPTFASVADSYQQCTFATQGNIGDWRVLKIVSAKADVLWTRVQRTA